MYIGDYGWAFKLIKSGRATESIYLANIEDIPNISTQKWNIKAVITHNDIVVYQIYRDTYLHNRTRLEEFRKPYVSSLSKEYKIQSIIKTATYPDILTCKEIMKNYTPANSRNEIPGP